MTIPPFMAALQSRAGMQGSAAPPAGPEAQAGAAPPMSPAGGLTGEIVGRLQEVNALFEQLLQSGDPIDPDMLAPEVQKFGQNLALLSSIAQEQGAGQPQGPGPGPGTPPMPPPGAGMTPEPFRR